MNKIWLPECRNFLVLQKLPEFGHPLLERDHGSFSSSSHLKVTTNTFPTLSPMLGIHNFFDINPDPEPDPNPNPTHPLSCKKGSKNVVVSNYGFFNPNPD
jgi:hypothetical protein